MNFLNNILLYIFGKKCVVCEKRVINPPVEIKANYTEKSGKKPTYTYMCGMECYFKTTNGDLAVKDVQLHIGCK